MKGPDALKIHKLTEASSGDVKGNKVTDFGAAAALQFDVSLTLTCRTVLHTVGNLTFLSQTGQKCPLCYFSLANASISSLVYH